MKGCGAQCFRRYFPKPRFIISYPKRADLPPGVEATQADVATAFGVSARTVAEWKRLGMPCRADGSFALLEVADWRRVRTLPKEGKEDLRFWATAKTKEEALTKAIDRRLREEDLFSREDVKRLFVERIHHLQKGLLALPRRLRMVLEGVTDPVVIEEKTTQDVRDLLSAYSRQNLLEVLEQWRRQRTKGVKLGRGRGRPKGS